MQALGCIFGAIVIFWGQFCFMIYSIFAGITIFTEYIIKKWNRGEKLQSILLYGVLSIIIAVIWHVANEFVVGCSNFLGAPHNYKAGLIFTSSILALSFISIAHYNKSRKDAKE
jgi:hypothetical protein